MRTSLRRSMIEIENLLSSMEMLVEAGVESSLVHETARARIDEVLVRLYGQKDQEASQIALDAS
jgi:hypothetical protein